MLLCSASALAQEFEVDGIKYNVTSTTDPLTVEVVRNGYSGDIVIPEKVEYETKNYSVTSIGYCAFNDCSGLTSVTIPNSVTSIGISAFYNCSGLTSVTIPSSVTSIEVRAFSGCSGLTYMNVNEGNTVYDSRNNCNAIIKTSCNTLIAGCKNTVIPNSVTSIGDFAFWGCSGLTSVSIPNSVTSIRSYAFFGCKDLTSFSVGPTTPIAIDIHCFGESNSTNATLYVPAGCVEAYQNANYWKDFNKIEEIFTGTATDGQGVRYTANADDATCTVSGYEEGCDTYISIPNIFQGRMVSSISDNAFEGCSGLTIVSIPRYVTSIGKSAFQGCVNLTTVSTCLNTPVEIDNSVFSNVANATLYVPAGRVAAYQTANSWTEFNEIKEFFTGTMMDEQGVRYTANNIGTCTVSGHEDSYNTSIIIPKFIQGRIVSSIGGSAFSNCKGLTSLTIPNSVTSIEGVAFRYCSGLTSFTIPNSVTSIGRIAFQYCSGLTSITIPSSVTSIEGQAFSDCNSLTSIVVAADNTVYDSRNNCNAVIRTKTNELIKGCQNTVIPNTVTCIGGYAFSGCSGLTSITIPNSVTSIGGHAFDGCI